MLPRADPGDRLIGAASLAELPIGARLGTSSPRRSAQLLARRPDLTIVPLRGNVATRLPGEMLEWDAQNLRVTNSEAATKLLTKNYREGWKFEVAG